MVTAVGLANVTVEFQGRFCAGLSSSHLGGPVCRFQGHGANCTTLAALLNSYFQGASGSNNLERKGKARKRSAQVVHWTGFQISSSSSPISSYLCPDRRTKVNGTFWLNRKTSSITQKAGMGGRTQTISQASSIWPSRGRIHLPGGRAAMILLILYNCTYWKH